MNLITEVYGLANFVNKEILKVSRIVLSYYENTWVNFKARVLK